MRWLLLRLAAAVAISMAVVSPASSEVQPHFVLGFETLHDLIPSIVGDPIENQHSNPTTGDALQKTSNGLLVWRKADNFTAFTDGKRT